MLDSYSTDISSLVASFSKVLDLVDRAARNHHLRTAYIAYQIGKDFGLDNDYLSNLTLAGCFHDIGIFSTKDKISALEFEPNLKDLNLHAQIAFILLKDINIFKEIAKIIKYHHVNYSIFPYHKESEVPIGSYVLHLADRIEVSLRKFEPPVVNREKILEHIKKKSGKLFMPELVDSFINVGQKIGFWLDMDYPRIEELVEKILPDFTLNLDDMLSFSDVIKRIIDYRSSFTAVHSTGVSAVAEELAKIFNLSPVEIKLIKLAGHLHDIGKLAVPIEILQKPGKLDGHEWPIMMSHAYYSYRILEKLKGLKIINLWGSLHHEMPNGKGYPFGFKEDQLLLGSKIMRVADVFVALSEDRPYRKGLPVKKAKEIMMDMLKARSLDPSVTEKTLAYIDELTDIREKAQLKAKEKYLETKEKLKF